MKMSLDCNIVRDMIPLYIEELTSEESNTAIEQHLNQCKGCKKYLEEIQEPIEFPTIPKTEIEHMRKVKRILKRKSRILIGVIIIFFVLLIGAFFRFFIIGSPIALDEADINYKWNYDAETEIYSIQGSVGLTRESSRIKVYEDKHSNTIMIKLYRIMPSIFFPDDDFSVEIPWNGETNVVWQGKYEQRSIVSSQDLNLIITKFQDGEYQKEVDRFDMDDIFMVTDLYNKAKEVSGDELLPFDEEKYTEYLIIILPDASGKYNQWAKSDEDLGTGILDDRIFLYQDKEQYYIYQQGRHLKTLSTGDAGKIWNYIGDDEVD